MLCNNHVQWHPLNLGLSPGYENSPSHSPRLTQTVGFPRILSPPNYETTPIIHRLMFFFSHSLCDLNPKHISPPGGKRSMGVSASQSQPALSGSADKEPQTCKASKRNTHHTHHENRGGCFFVCLPCRKGKRWNKTRRGGLYFGISVPDRLSAGERGVIASQSIFVDDGILKQHAEPCGWEF